jgi:hypothetical protein
MLLAPSHVEFSMLLNPEVALLHHTYPMLFQVADVFKFLKGSSSGHLAGSLSLKEFVVGVRRLCILHLMRSTRDAVSSEALATVTMPTTTGIATEPAEVSLSAEEATLPNSTDAAVLEVLHRFSTFPSIIICFHRLLPRNPFFSTIKVFLTYISDLAKRGLINSFICTGIVLLLAAERCGSWAMCMLWTSYACVATHSSMHSTSLPYPTSLHTLALPA